MKKGELAEKYLIIAGVPKAGTTSLFNYLSNHPAICGASIKETCFFLDVDYPRRSKYRFPDGIEVYDSLFGHCDQESIRLEATPVYLYSKGTATRIRSMLSETKIIIILREPVDRLYSNYRFALQRNVFANDYSFEKYVNDQLELFRKNSVSNQNDYRALIEGKYSSYLRAYKESFGIENILVVQFNMLKNQPKELMWLISDFAGIDPTFFDNFSFRVYHKTPNVRAKIVHSGYIKSKRILRESIHNRKRTMATLKFAQNILEPAYIKLNQRQGTPSNIPVGTMDKLQQFYKNEPSLIAEVLGISKFEWIS